jgi:hypothetical protein
MIDFIGDIHGHAEKLIELLEKLGYTRKDGIYRHPTRKVLFIGDYIDRGPQIRETLIIVRQMVQSGNAIALMGNHEYNALCFHHEESKGGHLRKHLIKNIIQHFETLKQFQNKQSEYKEFLDWFLTLPLYYETEDFRAAHACWDNDNIAFLRSELKDSRMNEKILHRSVNMGTVLYRTIEETIKGKEIRMPEGMSFTDKDGIQRNEIRIKWWENPIKSTYRKISVISLKALPQKSIDLMQFDHSKYYKAEEKPVFFGHYWRTGMPRLYRKNICCLDYSVAKGGYLAAYRFDGENELSNDKFVFV